MTNWRKINAQKKKTQKKPDGSLELRLRYYAAMLDKENLKKSDDYKNLPPITVIVISPKDVGGKGEELTFVGRVYMESATSVGDKPRRFEDKELFIFVNAAYKNTDTPVGKIIHDLTTINSAPKLVEEFAEAVDRYVKTEEGRKEMSGKLAERSIEVDDWSHYLLSDVERQAAVNEGKAVGKAEGKAEGLKMLAERLLANGSLDRSVLEKTFTQLGVPMPI